MDPGFLMEILEMREQLDAVRQQGNLEKALQMGQVVAAREKATHQRIATLLAEHDGNPSPTTLRLLGDQVAALRYFRRFQDEVDAIEEQVSP